jgi:hypothetical protein
VGRQSDTRAQVVGPEKGSLQAGRLQLFALAYNLANFMRSLVLPDEVAQWSLTTLRTIPVYKENISIRLAPSDVPIELVPAETVLEGDQ